MQWNIRRIIISGLSGGCGKTFATIGIISALKKHGLDVFPFKKGPDYIDSAWLADATGKPCYNLDTFLMGVEGVVKSFESHIGIPAICNYCNDASCGKCERLTGFVKNKIAIIEGNRGLFDGMDEDGTYSTAELAKLLKTGVILVLDSTKSTRTLAAEVLGCQKMDSDVRIMAVILNRVAGKRHEDIARTSIEKICKVPVVGAIPKLEDSRFPERHLGLITPQEYNRAKEAIEYATEIVETYVDLKRLVDIADKNEPLTMKNYRSKNVANTRSKEKIRIGIVRDAAFSFYYPDNIEALKQLGAEIIEINALKDRTLPDIDALYIGGGFPETNAVKLTENRDFMFSVREAVEQGLPVYAECGGAIYMGKSITYKSITYSMTGVLPLEFYFGKRPQGHGYSILEVEEENPYFKVHTIIHGHEFHYSGATDLNPERFRFIFSVRKGYGFNKEKDGILYKNLLAVYTHIHAAGSPQWAAGFINLAKKFSVYRKQNSNINSHKDFFDEWYHCSINA